jgi:hypothetical protein
MIYPLLIISIAKMNAPVCNLNCICVDGDCSYTHLPILKDRKIIKKLYDGLAGISKMEDNTDKRKANCRFGQLCYNEKCGFRHRLSVKDRQRLIKVFNEFKLNEIKVEKKVEMIKVKEFDIRHKNSFDTLDEVEEVVEKVAEMKVVGKSWADVCKEDDDFYMKF